MTRIAINGFGRIGRTFLRVLLADPAAHKKLEVVAINIGPAKIDMVAHLFKYDSVMGTFAGDVRVDGDQLHVDGKTIQLFSAADPATLPWKKLTIDWVVEASGRFTDREGASKHLTAGAGAVLITAPAKNPDVTIIPGVNDAMYKKEQTIVSLGSCTTNALLTTLKVLHDAFELDRGFMTTVHAYTNTQVLLDVETADPRRSRAAALNIIPTSTGARDLVGTIIPALHGKIESHALRVPVAKVSIIDLAFTAKKKVSVNAINDAFAQAAHGALRGIVSITHEPLVSCDFAGNNHSVIIDGLLTATQGEHMGKLFGWYDNEWGYSQRLKDFLVGVI